MKRYALVEDDRIVNIILADSAFIQSIDCDYIEDDGNCQVGYKVKNGRVVKPRTLIRPLENRSAQLVPLSDTQIEELLNDIMSENTP